MDALEVFSAWQSWRGILFMVSITCYVSFIFYNVLDKLFDN